MNVGVLVSGRGTNLRSLLDAQARGDLAPARVVLVVSNVSGVPALVHAEAHGVRSVVIAHGGFASREEFDAAVARALEEAQVELVALAGFMRLLTPGFLRRFHQRVLNIHPALLPAFPGLHVQRKALEYGCKLAGCTVHLVDEGTDTGPIVDQAAVRVYDDDTEESLSARILAEENRLYPRVVRYFAEGRVRIEGRRVIVDDFSRKKPL